jgi:hypothetical protein
MMMPFTISRADAGSAASCALDADDLPGKGRRGRYLLYVGVATSLYAIAWVLVLVRAHVKHTPVEFVVSDAVGCYAYLPSVLIDGDLRFDNQLQAQFRGEVPLDYVGISRLGNRWPIGVALTLSPAFLVAHGTAHMLGGEANGYSIVYMILCLAAAMSLACGSMIVADRLIVERFAVPGPSAAAAVLTWWLGTNYVWFWLREPFVAHLIGSSWAVITIYVVHRAEIEVSAGKLAWWRLPLIAFSVAMLVVCRFTNVFIAPVLVWLVVVLWRHRMLGRLVRQLPLILIAAFPLFLQACALHVIHGQVVQKSVQSIGYGQRERFFWTDPALVLSLFSSRRGLFFWTPALLFSAFGLIWQLTRRGGWRDGLLVSLVISAMALWYINASWYAWWLGNSAGNRGYIELAPLWIIGLGCAYVWLRGTSVSLRRAVIGFIAVAIVANYAVIAGKLLNRLEGHAPLIPWEATWQKGPWERF